MYKVFDQNFHSVTIHWSSRQIFYLLKSADISKDRYIFNDKFLLQEKKSQDSWAPRARCCVKATEKQVGGSLESDLPI